MKKIVALIIGLIITGVTATTVSAATDYEVKKGDNLWTIAHHNNTTVEKLKDINELDSSLIHPKQMLKLDEAEPEYYIVEKGDSLGEISRGYGDDVTVENLKAWNNLNSDLIIIGQQLVVNDASELNTEQVAAEQANADSTIEMKEAESVPENETEEATEDEVVTLEAEEEVNSTAESESTQPNGKTISVEATAYTAYCSGCSGITATGIDLKANPYEKVIAVDPNVIPLGTKVFVEGYGHAVAADTGGAIKGNKIDIHVPTKDQAYNWGRKVVEVTILE
ncbi:3D domain-containing protein [Oceanobacillus profundus]|uniref:LysM peptidoglycan-binding domain-containing protein n=1 Tax=Oceanobacillus profundus TaxID=372463 RepID=A0A417YJW0_9BACI|nr:3D domain-containing protein [Oceanobacillus profundus]MDO6449589.1 LysM peptidoglycan-binding domain-containing protein [Oceanobacillus profundus]RHW33595.1 LysM peptidoglycan-binding domain-containing protein [Oceanobacillus profundus]